MPIIARSGKAAAMTEIIRRREQFMIFLETPADSRQFRRYVRQSVRQRNIQPDDIARFAEIP
jgi:hypothetical protein